MGETKINYGLSAKVVKADALAVGDHAHAESTKNGLSMSELKSLVAAMQQGFKGQDPDSERRLQVLAEQLANDRVSKHAATSTLDTIMKHIKSAGLVLEKSESIAAPVLRLLAGFGF